MIEGLILTIVMTGIIYLLWRILTAKAPPIDDLKGKKLLYVDNGRGRVFRNKQHKIQCKPDYIYRIDKQSDAVVEYKNRCKNIYPSDVAQLTATAVAARTRFPNINVGYVCLEDGTYQKYDFNVPNDELISRIERELRSARLATANFEEDVRPITLKCNACSVRYACNRVRVD